MDTKPIDSRDIIRMRRAIVAAVAAMQSARTDKLGSYFNALHAHGFALVEVDPIAPEPDDEDAT